MLRLLLVLAFALAPAAAGAQHFDRFERDYAAARAAERDRLAARFIEAQAARGGFPLRDQDGTAIFLFITEQPGPAVGVRGDFTPVSTHNPSWNGSGEAMRQLAPGSPIFVLQRRFEPDARIDYQIVVDGVPRPDPLNPRRRDSGIHGEVSELVMPDYREPSFLATLATAPEGRMIEVAEPWARLRTRIYLPPGYDPRRRHAVLYTPDGAAWSDFLHLPQMMDRLIVSGRIAPFVAVLVDAPEDRSRFYYFAPDYLDYLDRVIAYVDARYPTIRRPEGRIHAGTSAGARAALFAALERPELIGGIAMISPSISGPPSFYAPLLAGERRLRPGTRIWISAGSYEESIDADARLMERLFRTQDLTVRSRYTHEGHSLATWRNLLPEMLETFFSSSQAPR